MNLKNLGLSLIILFLIIYPFLINKSNYFMTLVVMMFIFSISSMALNLLVGFGGQMSVGQAGFLSVGGYVVAILSNGSGLSFIASIILSGVITGLVGLVIGLPAIRLRGHFLAVATLGFGISIPLIALDWTSLTGGYSGLAVSKPDFASSNITLFYLFAALTVFITWLLNNIIKSKLGRAFKAIRDSEIAAQSTGINVSFYKTLMFSMSAFFTGIAGGMYGLWSGYVTPNDFSIFTSFIILAMVVVGGLASLPGSILGAVLLSILPHFTDVFVGITNIIIGIALVLIIMLRPKGLVSFFNLKINKVPKPIMEKKEAS